MCDADKEFKQSQTYRDIGGGDHRPGWEKLKDKLPSYTLSGLTPGVEHTTFTQSANRDVAADIEKADAQSFYDDWYKPMLEGFISDPVKGQLGEGPLSDMNAFIGVGDALASAGITGESSEKLLGVAGEDAKILKEDVAGLKEKGTALESAESEYDIETKAIESGLEDAEKAKKEGLLDTKIARQQQLSGSVSDFEQARAGLAKSGVAYSGFGEKAVAKADEEGIADMAEITRGQHEIMDTYRKTQSALEGKKTIAESNIDRARDSFTTGLSGLLGSAGTRAAQLLSQSANLPAKWGQFGQEQLGGLVGKDWAAGEGLTGRGYFKETTQDIPEIDDLTQTVGAAESASLAMRDILDAPGFFTPEGEDV
tara:strand:- start:1999 stop:3102 length:1104 start_codon:yes stop_codon:yes gene_type:complete